MTASRMMGMPQRMIAIQAASKGRGSRSKMLMIRDIPDIAAEFQQMLQSGHELFHKKTSFLYLWGYIHNIQ